MPLLVPPFRSGSAIARDAVVVVDESTVVGDASDVVVPVPLVNSGTDVPARLSVVDGRAMTVLVVIRPAVVDVAAGGGGGGGDPPPTTTVPCIDVTIVQ